MGRSDFITIRAVGRIPRVPRRRVVLLAAAIMMLPMAASAEVELVRDSAVEFADGQLYPQSVVSDGTFAYFGTDSTNPSFVVKVRQSDMSIVDTLTLETGESNLFAAVSDGDHIYFGASGGTVVKVRMSDLSRVDSLDVAVASFVSAVSDGTFAYFGTSEGPGRIVKVRMSDLTLEGVLTLDVGEGFLESAVIEADGTHAYFGTATDPGQVVKVQLSGGTCVGGATCGGMERIGALTLDAGEDGLYSAVSDGTYGYFGTETAPGQVVKVQLSGGSGAGGMERIGALELGADEDELYATAIDIDGTYAYFGTYTSPGRVVKVRLSGGSGAGGMERVGMLELEKADEYVTAMVLDGDALYLATETDPGRAVKVGSGGTEPSSDQAAPTLAVTCEPGLRAVGNTVTCSVTGGDPGIDILWRAAHVEPFAEAGVTLDDSGSGEFTFVLPADAVGQELKVELVAWLAPLSLGVVGGQVPSSVPSGGGPVPVWPLLLLALAGGLLLRRVATVGVRG